MGKLSKARYLQIGPHSAATNWTTFPASPVFVEPFAGYEVIEGYEQVPRDYWRGDGETYSALNGWQNGALNNLRVPLHGLSTPASNGNSTSAQLTATEDDLLTMLMGAAGSDFTGEAAHGTDSGDENTIICDTTLTDITIGAMVAATGDDSGLLHARWVSSVSPSSFEVVPDMVSRLDVNETEVTLSSDVYAMRTWAMAPTTGDRIHVGADVEGQDWRRRLYGMAGNMTLEMPSGGIAHLSGSLLASSWEDSAEASPSYSAPTQGSEIRVLDATCYIGGALYMAKDLSLDFGTVWEPRASDGAAQGKFGFVCVDQVPVLTATLHSGALTAPNEVGDSTYDTWKGTQTAAKTEQTVLVQVGRTAGAILGIYMHSAEIVPQRVVEGGQEMMRITATARRGASTKVPLYIGIG